MKIDFQIPRDTAPVFDDLTDGDCFAYHDILWMKVTGLSGYNAINLTDGDVQDFEPEIAIVPVKCKIVEAKD